MRESIHLQKPAESPGGGKRLTIRAGLHRRGVLLSRRRRPVERLEYQNRARNGRDSAPKREDGEPAAVEHSDQFRNATRRLDVRGRSETPRPPTTVQRQAHGVPRRQRAAAAEPARTHLSSPARISCEKVPPSPTGRRRCSQRDTAVPVHRSSTQRWVQSQGLDGASPPAVIEAATEHPVQQIVARSNGVEHSCDARRLFGAQALVHGHVRRRGGVGLRGHGARYTAIAVVAR